MISRLHISALVEMYDRRVRRIRELERRRDAIVAELADVTRTKDLLGELLVARLAEREPTPCPESPQA